MRSAYADERGDTGYQFNKNSSPRFVFVTLLPADPGSLLNRITNARRQLKKPETYEFHFSKSDDNVRSVFFSAIANERLHIWVATIYKRQTPLELQTQGKTGLYVHAIAGLALRVPIVLNDVKLHLDATGKHRKFMQALKNGTRAKCREAGKPDQNFKEIRGLNSTHPLIQCADMLAGAADLRAEAGRSLWWDKLSAKSTVWWDERFVEK
ncbi:MAG: DUF3800 domain-containing protein [Chloroflexota bacterium]